MKDAAVTEFVNAVADVFGKEGLIVKWPDGRRWECINGKWVRIDDNR